MKKRLNNGEKGWYDDVTMNFILEQLGINYLILKLGSGNHLEVHNCYFDSNVQGFGVIVHEGDKDKGHWVGGELTDGSNAPLSVRGKPFAFPVIKTTEYTIRGGVMMTNGSVVAENSVSQHSEEKDPGADIDRSKLILERTMARLDEARTRGVPTKKKKKKQTIRSVRGDTRGRVD